MSNSALEQQLSALENVPATNRVPAFIELLDTLLHTSPIVTIDVERFTLRVLGDTLGIVNSRQILSTLVDRVARLPNAETRIEIGSKVLQILEPRVISFEDQDIALKHMLADSHEANEDYISSARVLQSIPLSSSQYAASDLDKAKIWIRITRCYLEEDDPTNAITFLNRVKNLVNVNDLDDQEIKLQFQLSQAKISDSQRNFLDASSTYYMISEQGQIDEGERLQALSAAINCAILAPAGPKRVRQLARLYHDERALQVDEYGILQKIFLDRILSPQEVSAFSERLAPHQKAVTADGSTVLDRAVHEHNLLAASRLYSNIPTQVLGEMLGVDRGTAEVYAAQMIEQGRLKAHIDQIEELIYFDTADGVDAMNCSAWDLNVQALAGQVEAVAGMIKSEHPDIMTTRAAVA